MTTEIQIVGKDDLQSLAGEIRREHDLCRKALSDGLQHAINAGEFLLKAKTLTPRGTWSTWVRDHCKFSERTAQAYMRVARGLPILEAKAQHVADLSFREAVALLQEPHLGVLEKAQLFFEEFDHFLARWEIVKAGLKQALENATTVQQVNVIRNMAEQYRNDAVELTIRAEREMGKIIAND